MQLVSLRAVGELLAAALDFGRSKSIAKRFGTAVFGVSPPGAHGAIRNDQVRSLLSFFGICCELRLTNS